MSAEDTATLNEETRANGAAAADRRIKEMASKAERALREKADDLRERADDLRERARDYYDEATDRLDVAQRFITERVQEKPVAATLAAVGVGVVIGLLLAGGRRR